MKKYFSFSRIGIFSCACALVMQAALTLAEPDSVDVCTDDLKSFEFSALLDGLPTSGDDVYYPGNLTANQHLAREVLAELVSIDTTDRDGDNTLAAKVVAQQFLGAGFPAEDVRILAPAPRKGNLIVRFPGTDSRCEPLLLLAHLDVVYADRSVWEYDPFSFVEQDGYMYGRGVSDDKDEAAIHVANMLRLKAEGFQPRRDIILALTSDEEGGDYNGVQWLLRDHPEILRPAFALSEGGGGVLLGGEQLANEVQATEKGYQTYELVFSSPGGHSSMPSKNNAIVAAGRAMDILGQYNFPVVLNPVTKSFFTRSAPLNDGKTRWAMEAISETPPEPTAVEHLSSMPFYNASLRTTCVPTMVEGGHAENALPQKVTVTVNCRLLPTESRENVANTLQQLVGEDVQVVALPADELAPGVSLQPEILDAIERVTRSLWPTVPAVPIMGPGGTDGRFLRDVGIPVYGVNGIFIDVEDDRAHARNERLRSKSFYEGLEFMYRLTKVLSQ